MQRYFPADYRVIPPGADDAAPSAPSDERRRDRDGRRGGARGAADVPARAAPAPERAATGTRRSGPRGRCAAPATLGRALRERVRFVDAERARPRRRRSPAPTSRCSPRRASGRRPGSLRARARGRASCRSPRACRPTRSCCPRARYGLEFEPGDVQTLAAHLTRADRRRRSCASGCAPRAEQLRATLRWSRVADELEDDLRARSPPAGTTAAATRAIRARLADRR